MMSLLAASEKDTGQTESPFEKKAEMWWRQVAKESKQSPLERGTSEGDSPVVKDSMSLFKE